MPLSENALARGPTIAPHTSLDAESVRAAYARWARVYDAVFGGVSAFGRRRAVEAVNQLPGTHVLEVGVGTGLALPHYSRGKRLTGIDLSAEMLALARVRVRERGLSNVEVLQEVDAESTGFDDDSFDIAVAMFVASVVPHPRALLKEMRRVVKPGGHLLFVNHFAASVGLDGGWSGPWRRLLESLVGTPIFPGRHCCLPKIWRDQASSRSRHSDCSPLCTCPTERPRIDPRLDLIYGRASDTSWCGAPDGAARKA